MADRLLGGGVAAEGRHGAGGGRAARHACLLHGRVVGRRGAPKAPSPPTHVCRRPSSASNILPPLPPLVPPLPPLDRFSSCLKLPSVSPAARARAGDGECPGCGLPRAPKRRWARALNFVLCRGAVGPPLWLVRDLCCSGVAQNFSVCAHTEQLRGKAEAPRTCDRTCSFRLPECKETDSAWANKNASPRSPAEGPSPGYVQRPFWTWCGPYGNACTRRGSVGFTEIQMRSEKHACLPS